MLDCLSFMPLKQKMTLNTKSIKLLDSVVEAANAEKILDNLCLKSPWKPEKWPELKEKNNLKELLLVFKYTCITKKKSCPNTHNILLQ